jgi:hypothetical protein
MSASTQHMSLDLVLPWDVDQQQEESFRRLLKRVFAPMLVLFLMVPWLPVFEAAYVEPEQKLVKTKVLLKPPVHEQEIPPKPKPLMVQPAAAVKSKAKPKSQAKSKAKSKAKSGAASLAALSQQLSALRGSVDVKRLQKKNVSDNNLGKVKKNARTVLGKDNAVQRSGGIEVDKAVMSTQSATLVSHQATSIDSPIGTGGAGPASQRGFQSNIEGRRDMESIRRTFEKQKGSVYALYTRALRNYPELSGKFMFELTIEPDGSISDLRLVSSELGMGLLEKDILARINGINFGVADVTPTLVQYKFVFLPS